MDYIQIMTTVESHGDAEKIALSMVQKRLAACAQVIGPLKSYFHWQGAIDQSEEYLCLLKSRRDLFAELEKVLVRIHPYEVPEIVAVPLVSVGAGYLGWLAAELRQGETGNS